VIDAGGTGTDNTSIWLVGWGERTIHGIYPGGSRGGLDVRDLGEDRVYDSNSLPYQAYITMFKWDAGIAVRDWRYVVRVANIDVSDLSTTTPADLVKAMTRAYHKIPSFAGIRPAWYVNRAAATWLDLQYTNHDNVYLSRAEVEGKNVLAFRNIPVRTVDQILNTEARLT
jgi:hypothetical protein